MKVEMIMPQMGESITEAKISKWKKHVGDLVEKDEIILEISTDKVDSEIPAPAAGKISEILFAEGDVVAVKTKIALIDTDAKSASTSPTSNKQSTQQTSLEKSSEKPVTTNGNGSLHNSDKTISPVVKSLAEKHGVTPSELEAISGTGQGGRVTKQDFLDYVTSRQPTTSASSSSDKTSEPKPVSSTASNSSSAPSYMALGGVDSGDVKIELMDNMRQAIAEHMVRSKHTSPHVYSIQEVDMSRIAKYRQLHKAEFEKSEGFSLSFTPFFLEAAVKGLIKFPYINASVDGKKILLKKHINLGCAVALGNSGLIVPVIKNSEERNFVGLARGLNDLALRARSKKLLPDEVTGGTFTVTNPGVFGTIIGTPIINQPQVAILCLGAIKKRPVVVDDMIAIRDICYLTLSYDHRIIDGSLGGQYLAFLREYLENWDMERNLR